MSRVLFKDSPQGLDVMNGEECYRGFKAVAYNPSIAMDHYAKWRHVTARNPTVAALNLFASLTHSELSQWCQPRRRDIDYLWQQRHPAYGAYASNFSGELEFSALVGRFRFAEDTHTGPFCLRDLSVALALVDIISQCGGSCPFDFEAVGHRASLHDAIRVATMDGEYGFPEQALNAARILGWVRVQREPLVVSLTGDPFAGSFYVESTRRRPASKATARFGLDALCEDFRAHVWGAKPKVQKESFFDEYTGFGSGAASLGQRDAARRGARRAQGGGSGDPGDGGAE